MLSKRNSGTESFASGCTPQRPNLPPIASHLLEMGFTLPHILKAIRETNNSGEFNAQKVNKLAVWMLEHPDMETGFEGKAF